MEESAILLTLTQVTVAFVGFSAIIATFQFKDGFAIKKSDAINLQFIVATGLVGTFFSLLPLMLLSFGLSDSLVWALSSGLGSLNYLGFIYYLSIKVKMSNFRSRKSKMIVSTYFLIGILILILNLLNAFNILFQREFGPYFVQLIYPLCLVGYFFTRLIFQPIWKTFKNKESENLK